MQYFGGKAKIAKYIVPFLEGKRKENQVFLEPFVGGYNIGSKMYGKRIEVDYNKYLIELYKHLQNGGELPNSISEVEYNYIKNNKDENMALTGFVGFTCSYSGKWFGGYARDTNDRNYCLNGKNALVKKFADTDKDNTVFKYCNYKDFKPHGMLIYCDPPYKNTTKYSGTPDFDTEEFWEVMRKWSKDNCVYISEYEAPNDYKCVLEISTRTDIRCSNKDKQKRTEKLFTINN